MSDDQKSITSLADYIAVINELAASGEERRYIYRGQKDESWKVKSSALRRLQQYGSQDIGLFASLLLNYDSKVVNEVQLRYPNAYSKLTPLECMAHLQHNRVATGLIDFTYNPQVALWFACETYGARAGKVFVVNVQPDKVREIADKETLGQDLKTFFKRDEQWYLWQPTIGNLGNPALDSQRLTVQQSVFLFGAPEVEGGMIEREILVPHKCKKKILRELDRMGISEKTLFPDLAGFLERNTAESVYSAELAEDDYTEEIRKEKRREPMREDVQGDNYFQRGNFRGVLGKYQESIEDYDRAIELKPDFAEAHGNRGVTNFELKEYKAALEDYDRAISLKPDFAEAHNNRGNANRALGRNAEAVEDYDRAISLKPDFAEVYYNRGNAKAELGQPASALADYDRAISLKPDFAEAYSNRGNAKRALGRNAEAVEDYDRAIALKPDSAEAYSNRGTAKEKLKEYASALADYDRAIALKPDSAEAYSNRGNAKVKLKEYASALADYDRAIELKPDFAEAYSNRGLAKQALGRNADALADFKHALTLAQQQGKDEVAQYAEAKIKELESA